MCPGFWVHIIGIACLWWLLVEVLLVSKNQQKTAQWLTKERLKVPNSFEDIGSF